MTLNKTICQLKKNGRYIKRSEYSQGYFSFSTVEDPLKAEAIDDFTLQCLKSRHEGEYDLFTLEVNYTLEPIKPS